jgi:hypothetical protein
MPAMVVVTFAGMARSYIASRCSLKIAQETSKTLYISLLKNNSQALINVVSSPK